MRSAEQKAEELRQQVNAKMIWGARDQEVLDWLQERHRITGDAATALLANAHRAKRAAVRRKALLYLFFSIPGMLLAAGFHFLRDLDNSALYGRGSAVIMGVGVASLGVFIRSVFQLLSGETEGSVD